MLSRTVAMRIWLRDHGLGFGTSVLSDLGTCLDLTGYFPVKHGTIFINMKPFRMMRNRGKRTQETGYTYAGIREADQKMGAAQHWSLWKPVWCSSLLTVEGTMVTMELSLL